ncbi:MAG: hypothetical protein HY721_30190 [Planctomycetes bacterium]|nr:hypothetical protein [Planctomycetota bacterium]
MNELTDKFEKRGLTIIGVTDESTQKIKSFIAEKGIKYVIAIKGAGEYKTDGVPHGWLVGPNGSIVWEGHPAELKDDLIEENLKGVSLTPVFSLPKDLRSAQKDLNAGNLASGLEALESHLKKPKSPETEAAAKETIEKVKAFGQEKLQRAEDLAKERHYGDAAGILRSLEKSFKGHEYGAKAKETLEEWKKDKAIKLELDGASTLEKADALVQAKQYRQAVGLLAQLTKGKKYDGTKVREVAEKKLAAVQRKL